MVRTRKTARKSVCLVRLKKMVEGYEARQRTLAPLRDIELSESMGDRASPTSEDEVNDANIIKEAMDLEEQEEESQIEAIAPLPLPGTTADDAWLKYSGEVIEIAQWEINELEQLKKELTKARTAVIRRKAAENVIKIDVSDTEEEIQMEVERLWQEFDEEIKGEPTSSKMKTVKVEEDPPAELRKPIRKWLQLQKRAKKEASNWHH